MLEKIGPGSLLIVQGDRQDIIHAVMAANQTQKQLSRESAAFDSPTAAADGDADRVASTRALVRRDLQRIADGAAARLGSVSRRPEDPR